MAFKLPPLPYAENALEPHISARTLQFHHGKHHKKYVDTLNKLIAGSEFDNQSLEDVILMSADDLAHQKVFNNAAQVWNHNFFWQCMTPDGGGQPDGELAKRIQADFGSFDKFRKSFGEAAEAQFGSGWAWLVTDGGKLKITTTENADLPLTHGEVALLTCDVWEHAYYLDYQNDRAKFVDTFLAELANWDFAQQQLETGEATMSDDKKLRDEQLKRAKSAPQGREARSAEQGRRDEDASEGKSGMGHESGVEGEGSYTAARSYREGVEKSVKSGKIEEKAREAKRAFEGPEGEALREAEKRGQQAARMEDPALRRKATKQQG